VLPGLELAARLCVLRSRGGLFWSVDEFLLFHRSMTTTVSGIFSSGVFSLLMMLPVWRRVLSRALLLHRFLFFCAYHLCCYIYLLAVRIHFNYLYTIEKIVYGFFTLPPAHPPARSPPLAFIPDVYTEHQIVCHGNGTGNLSPLLVTLHLHLCRTCPNGRLAHCKKWRYTTKYDDQTLLGFFRMVAS
jgi:hypothetical protein